MTHYADPPRPFLSYSRLIDSYLKVALPVISEINFRAEHLKSYPNKGPGTFAQRASQINALSVLLTDQGRKSKYREQNWPAFKRIIDAANLDPVDRLKFDRAALLVFECLVLRLQDARVIPLTKISTFLAALARRPVISIIQLSEYAKVSESTAKRWLLHGHKFGILHKQMHGGQMQFVNIQLVDLIDEFAKSQRFAWAKSTKNSWIVGG